MESVIISCGVFMILSSQGVNTVPVNDTIKLITTEPMDFRNTTVVGLAVAVGMGVTQANASLAQFPEWMTTIFGKSPVVLATIVAIVLNLTLPKSKEKRGEIILI